MGSDDAERDVAVYRACVCVEFAKRNHAPRVAWFWFDRREPQHADPFRSIARDLRFWPPNPAIRSRKLKMRNRMAISILFLVFLPAVNEIDAKSGPEAAAAG